VKKISLFAVLMLITVLGAGTASFAACTATTLSAGNGTWGIESYGYDLGSSQLDNILMQVTFASGGTFTGSEWQSLGGSLSSYPSISGTWSMTSPASDCQGTMTVTAGGPSTQPFNFAINNTNKGGTLTQTNTGFTMAGFMVAQGTVTCSNLTFKSKQFSLYSYGWITGLGNTIGSGNVSATGEIKFAATGITFNAVPTVTLDLGGLGNFTVPGNGTSSIGSNCQGSGTLAVPSLGQSFSVDTVIVDGGKEALWIVTNAGDNVSGYFLE
jgi:hypothetical protein